MKKGTENLQHEPLPLPDAVVMQNNCA